MSERDSHRRLRLIHAWIFIAVLCLTPLAALGEQAKWQVGTILKAVEHQPATATKQYDVSIRVEKTVYVVLYAPEPYQPEPTYYVGMDRPVLIQGKTLKFNDAVGRAHSTRIIRTLDAAQYSK